MLASLARLYQDGARIDWSVAFTTASPTAAPPYPPTRSSARRFWIDTLPARVTRNLTCGMADPVRAPRSALHARMAWQPQSNWRQQLLRWSTGFDALAGPLEAVVAPVVAEVKHRHDLPALAAVREDIDRLAGAYLVNTLQQLGWQPAAGERVQAEALAVRLGVLPPQRRLLERLLALAAEDHWLQKSETGWKVVNAPAPAILTPSMTPS